MQDTFVSAVDPPGVPLETAWWFAFSGDSLLVVQEAEAATVPCSASLEELGFAPVRQQYLGTLAGRGCYSAELPADAAVPEGMAFLGLRGLYGRLEEAVYALAGRAFQITEWDRTHQFCGHCGTSTVQVCGERAKRCPDCGLSSYPRVTPAIIVLVSRGSEMLLARANNFPNAFYSTIAGFVEAGESLEEAVAREIKEEVGVDVRDIRYFGSQPWPFPHSLMIGFTATYAGGEIHVDGVEIADAAWFDKDHLPQSPSKLSIARKLIDAFGADE